MKLDDLVEKLNFDLRNEYKHMHFYLHSSFMLKGMSRLYLKDKLQSHASEEMGHVKQFAEKIRAFGATPSSEPFSYPTDLTEPAAILKYALEMEQEVVKNYHERHKQATKVWEETGKYYDLVVFLENHIEDSQEDIDELVKLLETVR